MTPAKGSSTTTAAVPTKPTSPAAAGDRVRARTSTGIAIAELCEPRVEAAWPTHINQNSRLVRSGGRTTPVVLIRIPRPHKAHTT
jgi:hypothetical protein